MPKAYLEEIQMHPDHPILMISKLIEGLIFILKMEFNSGIGALNTLKTNKHYLKN